MPLKRKRNAMNDKPNNEIPALPRILIIEEKETEKDLQEKRELFKAILDSRASFRRVRFFDKKGQ